MRPVVNELPSASCRWSSRLALFAVALLLVTGLLHRFLGLPTPTAIILVVTVYGLAALALAAGLVGLIGIWRFGSPGGARVAFGATVSALILASPIVLAALAREHPVLNDISTDLDNPPAFEVLGAKRVGWANPARYPGGDAAEEQAKAYPDIVPLAVNRSAEETFDLAMQSLRRLRYSIAIERAPQEGGVDGYAEANDYTMILGFTDDIAIRVKAIGDSSVLDVRSSSRYGRSDLGRNAERIREIFRELVLRLESTVPAADEIAAAAAAKEEAAKKKLKGQKNADRGKEALRKSRDAARRASRREQEQIDPPP
ncbi:MAG: DUF1499 domain-containing protein [Hyphomicrobium sp.]|nr:DUF1499 domain-containing protein [Hyphomicrobium sp.]